MRYLIFSSCCLEMLTKYDSDWRPETLEVGFVKSFALAHFRQLFEQIGKLGINVLINAVRPIKIPCNVWWIVHIGLLNFTCLPGQDQSHLLAKSRALFWMIAPIAPWPFIFGIFSFLHPIFWGFPYTKTGQKRFPKRHFDACPQTSLGLAREALAPPPPEALIVDCKDGILWWMGVGELSTT